jgi:hypothetical protein
MQIESAPVWSIRERGADLMRLSYETLDAALFLVANLVNLLIIGIMLSRPFGLMRLERALGLVSVACALPVGIAVVLNAAGGREWWAVVLPALLAVFLIVELILDYILRLEFRRTRLLWPYLLLFYLSLNGMIGYTFLVHETYGFTTLVTYFLGLLATWYSYSRVGHGERKGGKEKSDE